MIAGIDRGLRIEDIKSMEIGQLVDYVIDYNRIHGYNEREEEPGRKKSTVREATAADWDNMWG